MVRDSDGWGKTDDPRPCLVTREEKDLRYELALNSNLTLEDMAEIERRIKILISERTRYGRG